MLAKLTGAFGQTTYCERDALGLEIARLLPNDVTTYHNYDAAGQVTSILDLGPGGTLQSLYYTYDDDGQRTPIVREDNTRIYYSYDAARRLTGEDWLDPSDVHIYGFAYEYDAAGNRLKKTFNGEVTYYDYNWPAPISGTTPYVSLGRFPAPVVLVRRSCYTPCCRPGG